MIYFVIALIVLIFAVLWILLNEAVGITSLVQLVVAAAPIVTSLLHMQGEYLPDPNGKGKFYSTSDWA